MVSQASIERPNSEFETHRRCALMNPTSDGDSRLRIRAPTCGRLTAKPGVIIPVKALVELPRVSERLHFLRGWSPWEDRGNTPRRTSPRAADLDQKFRNPG